MGSIKQNYANNVLSSGKFDATDLTGTIPNTNINDNSIDNVTSFPAAGSGIPSVASDPPSPSQGDVWYNTTSNAFKYVGATTAGSWATGGNLNTARFGLGNAGSYTSALAFGGRPTAATESYDGTSWTEVNDLNTARAHMGGAGASNTSALAYGGLDVIPDTKLNSTESWNGTSWTEVNNLNTARKFVALGTGTNTAALCIGGLIDPPFSALVEQWNGTNWTETGDLNTARSQLASVGITTAALAFGGNSPGGTAVTESWNGSAWTETTDLNTARQQLAGAAFGTSTSTLAFGGNPGPAVTGKTELWNGTSWSEQNDLATAREYLAGAGTAANALAFGGSPTTAATEEWTGAGSPLTKTVTTA